MANPNLGRTNVHGFDFMTDEVDSLGLMSGSEFEPHETKLVKDVVRRGDKCLDIGANIGYYSVLLSDLVGEEGRVFCFEPDEDSYRLLNMNTQRFQNCHNYNVALSDSEGYLDMFLCDENRGMNRVYSSICCTDEKIKVRSALGDSFDVKGVDFIKIDIEGFEFAALKGLVNTIKCSPDVKILSEFCPISMREAGFYSSDYLDLLFDLGFVPYCYNGSWYLESKSNIYQSSGIIDGIDIDKIKDELEGSDNDFILNHLVGLIQSMGYSRPILENILWVRKEQSVSLA